GKTQLINYFDITFKDYSGGEPLNYYARFVDLPGFGYAKVSKSGFPEDIFPGEDTVFSQRLSQEQSALVCFLPAMRIRHRGRTSISEFMLHQQEFGFSRGRYALNITKRQQTLGRRLPIAALAAARRVGYFFYRTMQWNISSLPRLIIFSPLLLTGLFAWARGFSRGCELASMEHYESASSS
ncbi:MAG: hypothetical protein U9P00_11065, partial [Pseudomonadota bacterium]|nr:hypothetical protein [Pseudomonadota bacterium]